MKTFLGLTLGQCSGCSIFKDNRVIFSASEERYTRKKSDESYPKNSIDDGLKFCKIESKKLDKVIIAGQRIAILPIILREYSNFSVKDNLEMMEKYWYPTLVQKKQKNLTEIFSQKLDFNQFPFKTAINEFDYSKFSHPTTDDFRKVSQFYKNAISQHLDIDESKIVHLDHHSCHASYAFYGSPIRDDETLIFTADAYGDELSATISKFDKKTNKIIRLKEYSHLDFKLARIYRYTTLFLRMLPNEHEYKVMGLAPYYNGKSIKEVESVFENMQKLDYLNFIFNQSILDIFHYLSENLNQFRFDQIAAGLQSFTEKLLVKWISNAVEEFDGKSVVFSGGTSMNVKVNQKISQIPKIKKFFVCGSGGDESLGIGACYNYAESQNIESKHLTSLYLGSKNNYSEKDLSIFKDYNICEFKKIEQITELILDDKIIATCRGRMEMGSRALGNRSILADPRKRNNIEKINRMIKNRDFWMPFAPIVIDSAQDELLVNPKKIDSPFMTIAMDTKNGLEKIPAATHQYDGTARPQILKEDTNPILYQIIKKFYEKTGVPALLNTSFNLHGEPVVNTLEDALHVFQNSGLEVLFLDNHIIKK